MLGQLLRPGTPIHTHLHDKQEGVWNVEAFAANDEIILCAGLWDALTLWNHGYRNGTTVFSPEALTDDLLAALTEFSIKRVLTPCETLTAPLIEAGLEAFLVKLPLNLDINAFALQAANPVDALGDLLRHAEWIGRGTPSKVSVPFEPDPEACPTSAPFVACDEAEDDLDALFGDDDDPETDELPIQADHAEAELPPLRTASPVPMPPVENEPEVSDDEVAMTFGNRRYRVRGLKKNSTLDVLKVNLLVSNGVGIHVDSFDLYSAKNRKAFQDQAALELHVEVEVIKRDLGRVLLQLEEVQDKHLQAMLAPKDMPPEMDQTEQDAIPGPASRPMLAGPRTGRLPGRRRTRQQADRLSRRRLASPGSTAGRHHPVHQCGRQDDAHGSHPGLHAARAGHQVFGSHGPEPVLSRRWQPQAQDFGHRGGRRCPAGQLCPQAPAKRG